MNKRSIVLFGTLCLVLLTACSGGGGGGNGDPLVGAFVDSAVAGLRYVGPNHSGTTNAAGEYDYEPGDEVCFFVDDVPLGCPEGKGVVTPIDLFEDAEADDDQVLNVVRLLLSLDADGDPDNGIDVSDVETDETHAGIDFDQSEMDFANNGLVDDLVTNEGHDGTLPTAAEAESHFEESLEESDYYEQVLLGDFLVAIDGSLGESDFDTAQVDTPTFSADDIEDLEVDADESTISLQYEFLGETCTLDGEWSEEDTQEEGVDFIEIEGDVTCPSNQGETSRFVAYSLPDAASFSDSDIVSPFWVVYISFDVGETILTYSESALVDNEDAAARNASIDASGEIEFEAADGEIGYDCVLSGQMNANKDEVYGTATCPGTQLGNGYFRMEQEAMF